MKNKFLLYFLPIVLVACNGKQPSNIAKEKVNQDTLPVFEEQVDWRSIQTIDAHDEEKTAYYKECETILSKEAANVYIQDLPEFVALNKKYTGYEFYPLYVQDIAKLKLAE